MSEYQDDEVDPEASATALAFLSPPEAPPEPATERQIGFAQKLLHERVAIGTPGHLERTDGMEAAEEFVNAWDKRAIGDWIRLMKEQPLREVRAQSGRKVLVDPGFYKYGNTVVKVQETRDGGHVYAKHLDVDSGRWIFQPGLVNRLDPDSELSLEEAKQFGALYGRCCMCGRVLTNEESIENGIGPVCAEYFGA